MMRSCEELGMCQSRTPRCAGFHPFAPGVIEGPGPNERQTRSLQKWALWTAAAAVVMFLAGYLL